MSSAEDFIKAMVDLNEKNCIGKYIFPSAKLTPLREFIELACNSLGFDAVFQGTGLEEVCIDRKTGKELCRISEKYYRIADTKGITGDYSKIKEEINWTNRKTLQELVHDMASADLERFQKGMTSH